MFEQLTFVLALFALGISLEVLISTITKEELKRTLVPSKKVFVPFLRRTLLFFKRVPVLLRKLGTGIKRTPLFFKRIPVIGLVLGLGIAIAVIIFAVDYWSKPAPELGIPYFEAIGTVDYANDGDTITVSLTWVNESTEGVYAGRTESVRFSGGMDAPELRHEGGPEAKDFVKELCPRLTEVFLDLDNLATHGTGPYRDTYNRLLGVVYVRIDNTWINVNAEVLRWGQEAYPDHRWLKYRHYVSEFDPDEWLADDYPYVRERVEGFKFFRSVVAAVIISVGVAVAIIVKKKFYS